MHANGGTINRGIACVRAKWLVFARFYTLKLLELLNVLLCFSFLTTWPDEKAQIRAELSKDVKKEFCVTPTFIIHLLLVTEERIAHVSSGCRVWHESVAEIIPNEFVSYCWRDFAPSRSLGKRKNL